MIPAEFLCEFVSEEKNWPWSLPALISNAKTVSISRVTEDVKIAIILLITIEIGVTMLHTGYSSAEEHPDFVYFKRV